MARKVPGGRIFACREPVERLVTLRKGKTSGHLHALIQMVLRLPTILLSLYNRLTQILLVELDRRTCESAHIGKFIDESCLDMHCQTIKLSSPLPTKQPQFRVMLENGIKNFVIASTHTHLRALESPALRWTKESCFLG
jgi:hypothetical protein